MTASVDSGQEALGWVDLAPLHTLLSAADLQVRAAAAEAAARLPLSVPAWEQVGSVLFGLLETQPSLAVAQAAAHAPVLSLRRQLRTVAADGGHAGQHVASVALSEVGDDTVLAAEVSYLLTRALTEHTALRLASLPLERLTMSPDRIPDLLVPAGRGARLLWTAVAVARLGDMDRLDELLSRAGDDPTVLLLHRVGQSPAAVLSAGAILRAALRSVLPLPDNLIAHLDQQLSVDAEAHRVLRSVWLEPLRQPGTPQRLDEFADPLARFVDNVRTGSVLWAGTVLAGEAATLENGAPDSLPVYAAWVQVAESASAAWPQVAWTLGRAGGRVLVNRLSSWLADPDSALAACYAVRDAAGWLTTPRPPYEPSVVLTEEEPLHDAGSQLGDQALPVLEQPPWPWPTELVDTALAAEAPPTDPWAEEMPSFGAGFEPEASAPRPTPTPATPPPVPNRSIGAKPPMRGIGSEPAGGGTPAADAAQTRAPAYAHLSGPSAVVVEEEFELEVGLAGQPDRRVTAQPLELPDRPTYTLTIQLAVDGFRLRPGEQPTVELAVSAATPYPTAMLHLTPVSDPELGFARSILAVFSVDGHAVGSATRAILVVHSRADLPPVAAGAPPTGVDTALPSEAQSVDLTITINKGDDLDGRRLLWIFQSPHASVPAPAEPLRSTLGSRPDEFARNVMQTAGRAEDDFLEAEIVGAGIVISRHIPREVHQAIQAAAAAVGGPPSIQLVSAEPYIPWELARIDQPWLADAPPMLGAQAAVGRWALRESNGPTSTPPLSVSVRDMTIVRGVYERTIGFNRLKQAEQEAIDLQATYGATLVEAESGPFFACLRGEPSAEILHFAMHGKFNPMGHQDGLILVDGRAVDPIMILSANLSRHPFVFLNACQVGMAGEILGQYGGMAQSFVEAGASAVIAPLWFVQDDVARDVSLRFYEEAFDGTPPAEFLRLERARSGSGTHLAYVLYGHPRLQLTRSKEADGDDNPAGP